DFTNFTVTPPVNHAPVVAASDIIESTPGQVYHASDLFSVSDADNDTITMYQFYDHTGGAGSGHFEVNGAAQAATTWITLTPTQLAQTTFVGELCGRQRDPGRSRPHNLPRQRSWAEPLSTMHSA